MDKTLIIPSTRLFTAGEVQTGAYLNNSITAMANFATNSPLCVASRTVTAQGIFANIDTAINFNVESIDNDNMHSLSSLTTSATAISGSGTVVTVTAPNSFVPFDNITLSGFTTAAYNTATPVVCLSATPTSFTVSSTATGATSAGTASTQLDSRFTCRTNGWYFISGLIGMDALAGQIRGVGVILNGSRIVAANNRQPWVSVATFGGGQTLEITPVLQYLNIGDIVQFYLRSPAVTQTSITSVPRAEFKWISL
jgi:hypothetical protein